MKSEYNEIDQQEIRYLGDLKKFTVNPSDIFVLSIDSYLSIEQKKHIGDAYKEMNLGNRLMVLDGGLKLGVISIQDELEKQNYSGEREQQ